MNALTYDGCKSDMNTNTALIVLTSQLSLSLLIVCVNKSVTCSVIS